MLKLIKLEIKKFGLLGYIRGAIIANIIILACIFFINYTSRSESEIAIKDYLEAFSLIDTFITITFVVFASVLISRIIIGEYKNKTITTLFMYPINRRKLFIAKLSIVIVFTFVIMIISNLFIGISFYFFDQIFQFIPQKLTIDIAIKNGINVVFHALTASFISFISLYFGMRKKSSASAIVSAITIVSIICSSGGSGVRLISIITIPLSLSVIGILISYMYIRNIEHVDITN